MRPNLSSNSAPANRAPQPALRVGRPAVPTPPVVDQRAGPRRGLTLSVVHNGARIEALVLSPRAATLYRLMPIKAPPDTGKFLLAPMPGLLASVAVKAGQRVTAGEKLAVVEAMKMENTLLALQDGVVAERLAEPGASLAVDQPILRFE